MEYSNIISKLYNGLMHREEVRLLVPMGYGPGLPVLTVDNGYLCASFPFLRYKVTGEVDKTFVFPVKYIFKYVLPECMLVKFDDLEYQETFDGFDFDDAIGLFRHPSIKDLDREGYTKLKEETLRSYDKLAESLLADSEYSDADDLQMRHNLSKILEPSLYPFYRWMSEDFFNKYLSNAE